MSSIKLKGDTSGEILLDTPAVAGTNTLTLPAQTGTLATTTDTNNITNNIYNSLGTRNLIINGNMQIAQRGTSATGVSAFGYYTVDRWSPVFVSSGIWTNTQDTDVPTGQGFANSFKLECTTAVTSLTAGAIGLFRQAIEGQNLQQLKKGTANAESITLSFWVKSNKTGTYILELFDADNTRQISKAYTVDTADTWEKKTITYAGDTTGAFVNDNSVGLYVQWWIAAGSDRSSGTLQTSWASVVNANRAVGQVNLADSTANYINITGVQLEAGDTATPFEHLQYGQQLALCQRYCYEVAAKDRVNQVIQIGFMYDATRARTFITFPVTMRTYPEVTSTDISNSIDFNLDGNSVYADSFAIAFGSSNDTSGIMLQGTLTSGTGTAGETRYVRLVDGDVQFIFSAEL